MIRPPDPLPESPDALRAIIAAQQEQLVGLAAAQKVFEATIEASKARKKGGADRSVGV